MATKFPNGSCNGTIIIIQFIVNGGIGNGIVSCLYLFRGVFILVKENVVQTEPNFLRTTLIKILENVYKNKKYNSI